MPTLPTSTPFQYPRRRPGHRGPGGQVANRESWRQGGRDGAGTSQNLCSRDGPGLPMPGPPGSAAIQSHPVLARPTRDHRQYGTPRDIDRASFLCQPIRDNWNHDGRFVCLTVRQSGETDEQRKRSQIADQRTPGNHAASIPWPARIGTVEISKHGYGPMALSGPWPYLERSEKHIARITDRPHRVPLGSVLALCLDRRR